MLIRTPLWIKRRSEYIVYYQLFSPHPILKERMDKVINCSTLWQLANTTDKKFTPMLPIHEFTYYFYNYQQNLKQLT
jgi:hypothetical protein